MKIVCFSSNVSEKRLPAHYQLLLAPDHRVSRVAQLTDLSRDDGWYRRARVLSARHPCLSRFVTLDGSEVVSRHEYVWIWNIVPFHIEELQISLENTLSLFSMIKKDLNNIVLWPINFVFPCQFGRARYSVKAYLKKWVYKHFKSIQT